MSLGVNEHPFYRPLWRRIAIVVVTGGFTAFEAFYTRDGFWTVIFAAAFIYSLWAFLINYKPTSTEDK
jgi:hypothetical protein